MNDLKLYGTNDKLLNGLVNTVKLVSDDIRMEFGLENVPRSYLREKKGVA